MLEMPRSYKLNSEELQAKVVLAKERSYELQEAKIKEA